MRYIRKKETKEREMVIFAESAFEYGHSESRFLVQCLHFGG